MYRHCQILLPGRSLSPENSKSDVVSTLLLLPELRFWDDVTRSKMLPLASALLATICAPLISTPRLKLSSGSPGVIKSPVRTPLAVDPGEKPSKSTTKPSRPSALVALKPGGAGITEPKLPALVTPIWIKSPAKNVSSSAASIIRLDRLSGELILMVSGPKGSVAPKDPKEGVKERIKERIKGRNEKTVNSKAKTNANGPPPGRMDHRARPGRMDHQNHPGRMDHLSQPGRRGHQR